MDIDLKLSDAVALIKSKAREIGFSACGIAKAAPVDGGVRRHLESWLSEGCQDGMSYMSNHLEKRCDPRLLLEGAQSVISVALNYYPEIRQSDSLPQFAFYAYGRDYHEVVKERLFLLSDYIRTLYPDSHFRCFCDTAPLLEKYWAWKAGIGFIGKNTQLIIPGRGSYFFLGEIVTTVLLPFDNPLNNNCGRCQRCIDSCPTAALSRTTIPGLDARKCLSCQTIENRGKISPDIASKMDNRVYGCDTCQQVCPWNRMAEPSQIPDFVPTEELLSLTYDRLSNLSKEEYNRIFKYSAVKRVKYEGLMRNIRILLSEK